MREWRYLAIVVATAFVAACASSSSNPRQSTAGASSDLVTTAEIDATPVANAYDLVNRLRPRWLTISGARVGSISGGSVRRQIIVVYLDGSRLGGVEALRSVTAAGLKSLRYYDATRAATVVRDSGPDQLAGAILMTSRDR